MNKLYKINNYNRIKMRKKIPTIFENRLFNNTLSEKEENSRNSKNTKNRKLIKLQEPNFPANICKIQDYTTDYRNFKNSQLLKEEILRIDTKILNLKDEFSLKIKALRIKIIKTQERIQKNNDRIKYTDFKIKEILIRKNNETLPIQKVLKERRDRIAILIKELVVLESMKCKYQKNKELKHSKTTLHLKEDLDKVENQKKLIENLNLNNVLCILYEQKHMYEEDFRSCMMEKFTLISILEELNNCFIQEFKDKDF